MVNVKSKSNARTGGAVSSPNVDFLNTGHAAQSRYIAALANPFAAPAVPIPDSFLTAHCAKMGREQMLVGVKKVKLVFYKNTDDPTGDYRLVFQAFNASGAHQMTESSYVTEIGARLVAAGISFEDGAQASDVGGFATYTQQDKAYGGAGPEEQLYADSRTERNYGYGTLTYNVNRRQALDFEGNAMTELFIDFDTEKSLIVRWAAIVECDGMQGFTESVVAQNDFVITQSIQNHHAGVFADTPHPKISTHLPPSLTGVVPTASHHFSDMWHTAASWVSSAAGWAWNHKPKITAWANQAHQIYKDLAAFRGSISAARTGEIISLGARAAPMLLA